MKPLQTTAVHVLLYEGSGATPLPADDRAALIGALLDAGSAVTVGGSNGHAEGPGGLEPAEGSVVIVAGRFGGNGPPPLEDAAGRVNVLTLDITGLQPAVAVEAVEHLLKEAGVSANRPGRWKPWFPVIDYSRCTNCMQCLSFCLFDVYGTSPGGRIQVQNNDNCKTDCPACSRVCPEVAIMFPKYAGGPINGDQVKQDDLKRETMKVDISALLGGDLYGTLRKRSDEARQRFAKERDDKRAMSERMRCLSNLVKDGTIPVSALTSLPSRDEIERKAAEATERARAALASVADGGNGENETEGGAA